MHNNSPRIIEAVLELAIIHMIACFADKIEAIIIDELKSVRIALSLQ